MIYDGMQFKRSSKIVVLPADMWLGVYITFGRICIQGSPGAVRTTSFWRQPTKFTSIPETSANGETVYPLYAIPIPVESHSQTNLMYGKDGKMYLLYNGECYMRGRGKK